MTQLCRRGCLREQYNVCSQQAYQLPVGLLMIARQDDAMILIRIEQRKLLSISIKRASYLSHRTLATPDWQSLGDASAAGAQVCSGAQ